MFDSGPQFINGLMAIGIAWAFVRADPDSATTRALSFAMAMTGVSILARMALLKFAVDGHTPAWAGFVSIFGALGFIAAFEWTYRLRKTIPSGDLRIRAGDNAIRIAQGLIIVFALAAIMRPEVWVYEFMPGIDRPSAWSLEVLLLFVAPLGIATLLWTMSMLLCLNRKPDPAERARLVAVLVAYPFLVAPIALPLELHATSSTLGFIVLVAGALRHAQLHGRRGQFMSRFLSPQFVSLVNREGLNAAMREERRAISIVCCDLRGFTAFSGQHESSDVLALLRSYYDTVGEAVQSADGTIKDYAGDGILILVGAPLAVENHGARAVALAERIISDVDRVLEPWRTSEQPLGVGIGIASGPVTVGVIGGKGRLEYAAVGNAVNLASRLCDQARAGEILLARETAQLLERPDNALVERPLLNLKGFPDPIASFALAGEGGAA